MADPLVFDLSPSQSEFAHADEEIVMLIGPMGEGKTFCGVASILVHAARCGRRIRGALIRDTHQNIKISTVPDIQEILGNLVTFHDDYKKMIIHTTPKVDFDLFGIDDPASLSKLQGPQYAIIWLEEPAPIIEKANAGLSRDVFDMAVARASRQKGTKMRVQITQNPSDEDHWTEALANEPDLYGKDPHTGFQIRKKVVRIPYGENKFLNPQARAAHLSVFEEGSGQYYRYVLGKAAPVMKGKAVTPEYNASIHFAQGTELKVVEGAVGIRMWDAWQDPVCIIAQMVPPGKLWFHHVCAGSNMGVKELIQEQVLPLLNTPKYKHKIHDWRDIGDPTMRTPDQSSVHRTTARVLEDLLKARFEPGPTRWHARIDPTKSALTSMASDGKPKIYLSRTAHLLHRTLNGGWHWKKDNSGNVVGALPVKDRFDHVGMAFTYGVSTVFPQEAVGRALKKRSRQQAMKRAMSYRAGNFSRKTGSNPMNGYGSRAVA